MKKPMKLLVPSWRQDLECDADLAEEVARFFGYDNIPTTLPSGEATTGKLSFKLSVEVSCKRSCRVLRFFTGNDLFL